MANRPTYKLKARPEVFGRKVRYAILAEGTAISEKITDTALTFNKGDETNSPIAENEKGGMFFEDVFQDSTTAGSNYELSLPESATVENDLWVFCIDSQYDGETPLVTPIFVEGGNSESVGAYLFYDVLVFTQSDSLIYKTDVIGSTLSSLSTTANKTNNPYTTIAILKSGDTAKFFVNGQLIPTTPTTTHGTISGLNPTVLVAGMDTSNSLGRARMESFKGTFHGLVAIQGEFTDSAVEEITADFFGTLFEPDDVSPLLLGPSVEAISFTGTGTAGTGSGVGYAGTLSATSPSSGSTEAQFFPYEGYFAESQRSPYRYDANRRLGSREFTPRNDVPVFIAFGSPTVDLVNGGEIPLTTGGTVDIGPNYIEAATGGINYTVSGVPAQPRTFIANLGQRTSGLGYSLYIDYATFMSPLTTTAKVKIGGYGTDITYSETIPNYVDVIFVVDLESASIQDGWTCRVFRADNGKFLGSTSKVNGADGLVDGAYTVGIDGDYDRRGRIQYAYWIDHRISEGEAFALGADPLSVLSPQNSQPYILPSYEAAVASEAAFFPYEGFFAESQREPNLLNNGLKPHGPVEIDRTNPLTDGLEIALLEGNAATEHGAAQRSKETTPHPAVEATVSNSTILYGFSLSALPNWNSSSNLYGDANTGFYYDDGLKVRSPTVYGNITIYARNTSSENKYAALDVVPGNYTSADFGRIQHFGATIAAPSAQTVLFYANGVYKGSSSAFNGVDFKTPSGGKVVYGADNNTNDPGTDLLYCYRWSRVLSLDEIRRVQENPYQFLRPADPQPYLLSVEEEGATSFTGTGGNGSGSGSGKVGQIVADFVDVGDDGTGAGTGYAGTLSATSPGSGSTEAQFFPHQSDITAALRGWPSTPGQQPQMPVVFDAATETILPLAGGVAVVNDRLQDIRTGADPTYLSNAYPDYSAGEVGTYVIRKESISGSNQHIQFPIGTWNTRNFTFIARVKFSTSWNTQAIAFSTASSAQLQVWPTSSQWDFRVGSTNYTASGSFTKGRWYDIAVTGAAGGATLFVDGVPVIEGSAPSDNDVTDSFEIMDSGSSGDVAVQYAAIIKRPLSENEIRQVSAWGWFTPANQEPYILPVEAAAASTAAFFPYEGFFAESQRHPDSLRRNVKPVGEQEIDWSLPITDGLQFAWIGGKKELAFGALPSGETASQDNLYEHGECADLGTSALETNALVYDLPKAINLYDGATVVTRFVSPKFYNNNLFTAGISESGGSTDALGFWGYYNANSNGRIGGSGWAGIKLSSVTDIGDKLLASVSDSSGIETYADGPFESIATAFYSGAPSDDAEKAAVISDIERAIGHVAFMYVWDRALSADEIALLTDDNYLFLRPANSQPYLLPVAGGATSEDFSGTGGNGSGSGSGKVGQIVADFIDAPSTEQYEYGTGTGYAGQGTFTTVVNFTGTGTAGTASGSGKTGTVIADYLPDPGEEDVGSGIGYGGTLTRAFVGEGSYEDGSGIEYAGTVVADFIVSGANSSAAGVEYAGSTALGFTGEASQGTGAGATYAGTVLADYIDEGSQEVGAGTGYAGVFSHGFSAASDEETGAGTGYAGTLLTDFLDTADEEVGAGTGYAGQLTTTTIIHFTGTGTQGTGAGVGYAGTVSADYIDEGSQDVGGGTGYGGSVSFDVTPNSGSAEVGAGTGYAGQFAHGWSDTGTQEVGTGTGYAGTFTSNQYLEGDEEVGAGTGYAGTVAADFIASGTQGTGSGQGYAGTLSTSTIVHFTGTGSNGTASGIGYAGTVAADWISSGDDSAGAGAGQTGDQTAGVVGEASAETGAGTGYAGTFAHGWADAGEEEVGAGQGYVGTITTSDSISFVDSSANGTASGAGKVGQLTTDYNGGNGTQDVGAGSGQAGTGSHSAVGEASPEVGAGTGYAGTLVLGFVSSGQQGTGNGVGYGGAVSFDVTPNSGSSEVGSGTGHAGTFDHGWSDAGTQEVGAGTGYAGTFTSNQYLEGDEEVGAGVGYAGEIAIDFKSVGTQGTGAGTTYPGTGSHGVAGEASEEVGAGQGYAGSFDHGFSDTGEEEVGAGQGYGGTVTTSDSVSFVNSGTQGTASGAGKVGQLLTDYLGGNGAQDVGAGTGQDGTGVHGVGGEASPEVGSAQGYAGTIVLDFIVSAAQGTAGGVGYGGAVSFDVTPNSGSAEVGSGVGYAGTFDHGWSDTGNEEVGSGQGYAGTLTTSDSASFSGAAEEEVGSGVGYAGTLTLTTVSGFTGTGVQGAGAGTGHAGQVIADFLPLPGIAGSGAGTTYGGSVSFDVSPEGQEGTGSGSGQTGQEAHGFSDAGTEEVGAGQGYAGTLGAGVSFTGEGAQGTGAGTEYPGTIILDFSPEAQEETGAGIGQLGQSDLYVIINYASREIVEFELSLQRAVPVSLSLNQVVSFTLATPTVYPINLSVVRNPDQFIANIARSYEVSVEL